MATILNPYADAGTRWLTGEIHAHVCRSTAGYRVEPPARAHARKGRAIDLLPSPVLRGRQQEAGGRVVRDQEGSLALLWGYAGNDSFWSNKYSFNHFDHLALVYVSVRAGQAREDIVDALQAGRFYSSSGVQLSKTPLRFDGQRVVVSSLAHVDWCCFVHHKRNGAWHLDQVPAPRGTEAEFVLSGDWKYARIRATDPKSEWKRAWLQPLVNRSHF